MKLPLLTTILLASVCSLKAQPTEIHAFKVLSNPPQEYVFLADLSQYESYFSSDPVSPNLEISPKAAYDNVKKEWEQHYGAKVTNAMPTNISYYPIAKGKYLWFYTIDTIGLKKDGSAQRLEMVVMPNGEVVLPTKQK